MAFEDWEKDADGLRVHPFAGYETFTPFGMMCGIRIRYSESQAKLLAQEFAYLPLIMTVDQARAMAAALTKVADRAEARPSGETPQ